jgi:hypothetical protein
MKLLTDLLVFNFFLFNIRLVAAQSLSVNYTIATFDATKLTGLSDACGNVYNADITNCGMTDFLPTIPCSSSCVLSLMTIQSVVQTACAGSYIASSSLLSLFMNGMGVQELCNSQKLAQATLSTSFVASVATATATQQPQQSSAMATTSLQSSATAAAITGGDTMTISHGAVIAIVISVIVAISVLVVVGTVIFRKNYG